MQLSIIIISWNTLKMTRECLETVFSGLSEVDAEVIVVDNASSDGSREMVEESFPEAVLIANSENRGFAAANNQAIEISKGEYVLLLNSDTLIHGDVLPKSVEYLEQNPDVGVMGCRVLNTDGSLQPTCSRFPTLINLMLQTSGLSKLRWPKFLDRYQMVNWNRDDERDVDVVTGCYMLVRRTAMEQVGLLDENFFFYGEETDWCKRFQDAGWNLRFAPVGVITHHGGGSVRKLNYKRDLMLTSATVKLHAKHYGLLGSFATWLVLLTFNATRAAYWSCASLLQRDAKSKERRNHFINVVLHHHRTWSTKKSVGI
ncbi:glycosyltransferase family 2 protein [Roseibium sp. HPY-6]|uniref:glycosyltransferase family 2 protein n=1 Tax=Roseibium sp. HPY-6 TaxID=3229852 RepID=UPI00338DA6CE